MSWLTLGPLTLVLHLVVFSTYIALQRRKPTATLAWILLVAVLPIFGLAMWVVLGGRRIRRQRRLRRAAQLRVRPKWQRGEDRYAASVLDLPALSPSAHQMMLLGQAGGRGGEVYPGNHTTLYLDPAVLFDALEAAILSAEHHVHLQYYIYRDDDVGRRLQAALIDRARAGLKVRCLFDGLGSFGLGEAFFAPLRAAGAEVSWFLPLRLPGLSRAHPWFSHLRNHRKLVIIDGVQGFTGGVNVGDEYAGLPSEGHRGWRDTHLALRGPVVRALQEIFLEDWMFAEDCDVPVDDLFPVVAPAGEDVVQLIASGPDDDWDLIHKLYFQAIVEAQERVYLTTPYFIPDPAILTALTTAALRGVDVRLLVPAEPDVRLIRWAARSYYAELLAAGVTIYEFTSRMLHAKTLVVDGEICSVGSANMDIRSFELNFEANAFVYCRSMGTRLEEAFMADIAESALVESDVFDGRPLRQRVVEGWARLLSPVL